MRNKIIIALASAFVSTTVTAGSLTVPNTFVDGDTASAGEVNNNFDAIESAVNDNDSRITSNTADIVNNTSGISANTAATATNTADIATNVTDIQANATAIGSIVLKNAFSVKINGSSVGALIAHDGLQGFLWPDTFLILLDSELMAVAGSTTGLKTFDVYYTGASCDGQGYVSAIENKIGSVAANQGLVFGSPVVFSNPPEAYYIPSGTAPVDASTITFQSKKTFFSACAASSGPVGPVYEAVPNNDSVTGVTGADFDGAITYGF